MSNKRLLYIRACSDLCSAETEQISAIAKMFDIEFCDCRFADPESFKAGICSGGKYDYLYLAAHANSSGFGEATGPLTEWTTLAVALCEAQCLNPEAILLLACCRGGLTGVAHNLMFSCDQIDFICGPRCSVRPPDLVAGLHIFLYNIEIRREQPSVAAQRASASTGYDFFCHDRMETEDRLVSEVLVQQARRELGYC